jgi:hypothetical protein
MRQSALRLLIVAGFLLVAGSCGEQRSSNSLEGAWELIEAKYDPPDPNFAPAEWRQIKLVTRTHWAYLSQKRSSPKLSSLTNDAELLAAAKAFGAGGGTYTLDGDVYTERIEWFSTPNHVGTSVPYKIKWEGDEWIQTGTFPMKSLGLADRDQQLYERYRRAR